MLIISLSMALSYIMSNIIKRESKVNKKRLWLIMAET